MKTVPSWCRVGAKVVYVGTVHPEPEFRRGDATPLTVGSNYTIRQVVFSPLSGAVGVYVEEVINDLAPFYWIEKGYYVEGFRPLVTIEDDIATHFAQHLTAGQPRTVEAFE